MYYFDFERPSCVLKKVTNKEKGKGRYKGFFRRRSLRRYLQDCTIHSSKRIRITVLDVEVIKGFVAVGGRWNENREVTREWFKRENMYTLVRVYVCEER